MYDPCLLQTKLVKNACRKRLLCHQASHQTLVPAHQPEYHCESETPGISGTVRASSQSLWCRWFPTRKSTCPCLPRRSREPVLPLLCIGPSLVWQVRRGHGTWSAWPTRALLIVPVPKRRKIWQGKGTKKVSKWQMDAADNLFTIDNLIELQK